MIKKIKDWRLDKIKKWAQWYADFIIRRLEESQTEWEFNFWLTKGYAHDSYMIEKYDFYLD
jgi:hypothetical protein